MNKKEVDNKGVFIIYTGGTIGSMPKDPNDPDSPQVVVSWEKFKELTPQLAEDYLHFKVDAYSTQPLDSCNIGPKEWKEMADVIKKNYNDYEGFVILHGTDTMVYTASALSFMLKNLAKPVIITGAQLAFLFNVRNDGFQNMITALQIANPKYSKIPVIPEVCIYFGGKLLRGNRCRKINASGFEAYQSPNYSPLGAAGESISVDERLILKLPQGKTFTTQTRMEKNVVAINFFPGIQDGDILKNILSDEKLKGVVLMAYGAGNIPTKTEVMQYIKEVTDRGVVVLDVTQCGGGKVELGMYETSALLLDVGVVSGVDITPEAALTKLMLLLGDEDMTPHEVALKVQQNIAGEQSLSIYTTEFKSKENQVDTENNRVRIPAADIEGNWETADQIDRIMLRFRNGKIQKKSEKTYVDIKLFINIESNETLDEAGDKFLGTFSRIPNDTPTILFFDITEKARRLLEKRSSFTVVMASEGFFTWDSVELTVFKKETI
ncbi:MAG: L-asparaginase, type [Acidobacteriota bacterium]|nr:L-asparaginase, type [Acidobacteriota bacterium]